MRTTVQEIEIGPFSVELSKRTLLRDGIELDLRPQAFRALKALIQNKGQYVDYERMIAEAWDGFVVSKHTVDVTVGEVKSRDRIRERLFRSFAIRRAGRASAGRRSENGSS